MEKKLCDKEYFNFIDKLFNNENMDIIGEFVLDDDDDYNFSLKENDQEKCNISLDINKITSVSFSDKPKLTFEDITIFTKMEDPDEGYLNYASETDHAIYRFQLINGYVPSLYKFDEIVNTNKFINNLFKYYTVPHHSYVKSTYQDNTELKNTHFMIAFSEKLVLCLSNGNENMLLYSNLQEADKNSMLYTVLGLMKSCKKPKVTKNKIYIVYRNSHGFDKMGFDIKKTKIDLDENYNNGFVDMSNNIIEGLNSKNKTNLVILSGEPGTGKCVSGNTKITVRNKKTGKIEEKNIADLM